jgi:5-methylcytosine-specific restriction protein A
MWSWSFVNHDKRFVIFGAWDRFTEGKKQMILAEDWHINRKGRKSPGYDQSREHIRLIEETGFRLFTFPMKYSEELEGEDGTGPGKIGGFIPELREKTLTRVGSSWYAGDPDAITPLPDEIPHKGTFSEGAKITVIINAYERSAKARAACVAHHGFACAICGFKFQDMYGDLGVGFIHVHHLVPIGTIREEYQVDPIADLVPVCPNCHSMIHIVEPPLTVNQLKQHLVEKTNKATNRLRHR